MVATICTPSVSTAGDFSKKKARNHEGAGLWRSYSSQISEQLWRIPAELFCDGHELWALDGWTLEDTKELRATFDYALFAAIVTDGEMPMFSSLCDGIVLVLTANRTRREAALWAKEQILRYNVPLLGTVLDGRVLPIPGSIYRRL